MGSVCRLIVVLTAVGAGTPRVAGEPAPPPDVPVGQFAGEWAGERHHMTIDPDGRGFVSVDSAADTGEFDVVVKTGSFVADLPEPRKGVLTHSPFTLRLKDPEALELLDQSGRAGYVLKRSPPRPQPRVGDLTGRWEAFQVTARIPPQESRDNSKEKFAQLSVALDGRGSGTWRFRKDPPTELTLQSGASGLTLPGLEGQDWKVGLVSIGRKDPALRLWSADGVTRVYLHRTSTKVPPKDD